MPGDLKALSSITSSSIFSNRKPIDVKKKGKATYAISWQIDNDPDENGSFFGRYSKPNSFVNLPIKEIGIVIHKTRDSVYEHILFNRNHPYIVWLQDTLNAYSDGKLDVSEKAIERLAELTDNVVRYRYKFEELQNYLKKWKKLPNLPSSLFPPDLQEEDVLYAHPLVYLTSRNKKRRGTRKSKS